MSEYDILQAIADVSSAIGAIDTLTDFVDSRSASVLRRYRGNLANAVDDLIEMLEGDE